MSSNLHNSVNFVHIQKQGKDTVPAFFYIILLVLIEMSGKVLSFGTSKSDHGKCAIFDRTHRN